MNNVLKGCFLTAMAVSLGLLCPAESPAAGKILIRISHTGAADNEFSLGYEKFKDLVEARTNGQVQVKIFPNAVLGSDRVAGEATQQGNLEVVSIATNILSSFTRAAVPFDLPFACAPEKMDAYMRSMAYGDINKYLREELEKVNLVPFMFNATAPRSYVFSKKNVTCLADMKGIKIRATPSPIDVANAKAVGMNPTALAFDAVYQALQPGTVDGELLSFLSMKSFGRAEIIKSMLVTQHNFPVHVACMNKAFFYGLPDDTRQTILDCAREAQEWEWGLMDRMEEEGLKYCRDNGVAVNFPDERQMAEIKQAFRKVWEEFGPQLDPKMVELIAATKK